MALFYFGGFGEEEPRSGVPRNPGRPVPSGNLGRTHPAESYPLLWDTVRALKASPNYGKISYLVKYHMLVLYDMLL